MVGTVFNNSTWMEDYELHDGNEPQDCKLLLEVIAPVAFLINNMCVLANDPVFE